MSLLFLRKGARGNIEIVIGEPAHSIGYESKGKCYHSYWLLEMLRASSISLNLDVM